MLPPDEGTGDHHAGNDADQEQRPTDWLRTPLAHSMRWTVAETSSAAAPRTRSLIGPFYPLGDTWCGRPTDNDARRR